MNSYLPLKTQIQRRTELYSIHRETHRENFSSEGAWIGPFARDNVAHSREWLWHAIAFLDGDKQDAALGNTLITATPNMPNHFNSLTAAQILLHYHDVVTDQARNYLIRLMNDGMAESVDFSLAITGVNNFSAMRALFFATASQVLDLYEVPYIHKSIPEVYNRYRLRQFGRNVLVLMEKQLERTRLAEEYNTTNYSPITLMAISEISRWIQDKQSVDAAARIERRLWEEWFAFYHPRLRQQSGPHARANLCDTVAHASNWKTVWALLGLDGETRVQDLLYPPQRGGVMLPAGDASGQQCEVCWLLRAEYRVPQDLLEAAMARTFPYSMQATYEWQGQGFQRKDGSVIPNVEGNWRTAGGNGMATCYQQECFSIGSMSESQASQGSICNITYRHHKGKEPLGTVRTATLAMVVGHPPEFVENEYGDKEFPPYLVNHGFFQIDQSDNTVTGTAHAHFSGLKILDPAEPGEISLCLFVAEQLPIDTPVALARLHGKDVLQTPFSRECTEGTFEILDGEIQIILSVHTGTNARFIIDRTGGFLRCAVVLFEGQPGSLDPETLDQYRVSFELSATERQKE